MATKTYDIVINAQTAGAIRGIGGVANSLKALGATAFAAAIVTGFKNIATASIDATKQFQTMHNQLRLVTKSSADLEHTLALLTGEASRNRTSIGDTVELYSRLALVTGELELSQKELLTVTNNFSRALAISGADTNSAAAAMRQFGQAMGSPVVQSEEFNTLLDTMGPALVFVARDAGLTVAELRNLVRSGDLASATLLEMFKNTTSLSEVFNKTNKTTEQLEQGLSDAFTGYIASTRTAFHISRAYDLALKNVTRRLNDASGATDRYKEATIKLNSETETATKRTVKTFNATEMYTKLLNSATDVAKKYENVTGGTALDKARARQAELNNAVDNYVQASNAGIVKTKEQQKVFRELRRALQVTEEEIKNLQNTELEKANAQAQIEKDAAQALADRQNALINQQRLESAALTNTEHVERAQQKYNETIKEARAIFTDQITLQRVLKLAEQQRILEVQEGTKLALEQAKQLKDQEIEDFINAEKTKRDEALKTQQYLLMKQGLNQKDAQAAAENIKKYEEDKTSFLIDQGANFFSAFKGQSKEAFNAFKAFSIAQTVIKTYEAAMSAYASLAPIPIVGPALGAAAAAAAVGFGMAQVNQIRSQQYSGREFGGPVTGGSSYIVGERGPEVFTPSGSGMITPNNALTGKSGQTAITFNINATDADGFDDLLIQRKPLIVGMVQEAMNRQGSSL